MLQEKDIASASDDPKEEDTKIAVELSTKEEASEANVEASDTTLLDDEDITDSRDHTKDKATNTVMMSKEDEHAEWKQAFEKSKARGNVKILPSYYRFHGECYVNGMMNGEAIGLQNRGIIDKDFTLKEMMFELR